MALAKNLWLCFAMAAGLLSHGCSASDDERVVGQTQSLEVANPGTMTGPHVAFTVLNGGTVVGHKPDPSDFFTSNEPGAHLLLRVNTASSNNTLGESIPYDSTTKAVSFNTNLLALGVDTYTLDVWAYPGVASTDWESDPAWFDCESDSTCHTRSGLKSFEVVDTTADDVGESNCGEGKADNDNMLLCEKNEDRAAGSYAFPFACPAGEFFEVVLKTTKCITGTAPCTSLNVVGSSGTLYGLSASKGKQDRVVVSSIESAGECVAQVSATSDAKFGVRVKKIHQVTKKDFDDAIEVFYPTMRWSLGDFASQTLNFGQVNVTLTLGGNVRMQRVGTVNPFLLTQSSYALDASHEFDDFYSSLVLEKNSSGFRLTSQYLSDTGGISFGVPVPGPNNAFSVTAFGAPFTRQVGDWKVTTVLTAEVGYQLNPPNTALVVAAGVAGVVVIGVTLVEDFLPLGGGVANDAPSFALAAQLLGIPVAALQGSYSF